jgi:hypothetical protein
MMAEEIPRERAYDIFNDLNSDDDFEVHCRDEGIRRWVSLTPVRAGLLRSAPRPGA